MLKINIQKILRQDKEIDKKDGQFEKNLNESNKWYIFSIFEYTIYRVIGQYYKSRLQLISAKIHEMLVEM